MNDYNWNLDILQHAEDVVDSKGKHVSTATGHAHYTKNWKKPQQDAYNKKYYQAHKEKWGVKGSKDKSSNESVEQSAKNKAYADAARKAGLEFLAKHGIDPNSKEGKDYLANLEKVIANHNAGGSTSSSKSSSSSSKSSGSSKNSGSKKSSSGSSGKKSSSSSSKSSSSSSKSSGSSKNSGSKKSSSGSSGKKSSSSSSKSSSKESNEDKKKKETETVNKVVDKVLASAEVNLRDVKFDGSDKSMNLINSVLKGLDGSGAKNLPSSAKIIDNMKERQRKLFPDSVAHSAHLSENWTKEDQSAYNKEYYRQHRDEILARKAEKGKHGQLDLFNEEEGAALMDKIVEDQENQMNWLKEHPNTLTDSYRKLIEFMNTPISQLLPLKKKTPKQPEKKTYAPGTLGYAIDNGQEDEWFDSLEKNKKRRQSFEHSSINDPQFGIPEQKKFPLDTRDHVISAIRFFNYADRQYRKELAERIIRKIHQYGIEVTQTEQNDFYKYYQPR